MCNFFRLLCVCLCVSATTAYATEPVAEYGWKKQVVFSVNLTQIHFNNWAKGGESAMAWQTKLHSRFTLDKASSNWDNKAQFTYGQSKIGDLGVRKTADEIKLETIYTLKRFMYVNPFVSASAQTQFTSGYNYGGAAKVKISQFLDPGYFTQNAGVGYASGDQLKIRLGATLKETVTRDFPGYADNPKTPGIEKNRVEGGVSFAAELNRNLSKNIVLSSELNAFSNLKAFKEIDVAWSNVFSSKVAKYVQVTLSLDWLYDRDLFAGWQFREVLSVGFTVSL